MSLQNNKTHGNLPKLDISILITRIPLYSHTPLSFLMKLCCYIKQLYPAYQDRLTKSTILLDIRDRSSNIHLIFKYSLISYSGLLLYSILYTAAEDYGRILTTTYFRPNHFVALMVQVKILDDVLREEEERFTVELTAFDLSVVLVNSITEVVIEDNDGEGMTQIHIIYSLLYEILGLSV